MSRVNEVLSSVKKTTNIYFVRHSKYWKDSEFVTKARLKLTDKVEALIYNKWLTPEMSTVTADRR